jgi:ribosomal protein S18 acetylase RimI-like enzyme
VQIRPYQSADEPAVIDLWMRCGLIVPHNNPQTDIQRKLRVAPDLFLVGVLEQEVVAAVMVGYEGHRGTVNYLAVEPRLQMTGYGRQIMRHAENLLRELGCPKINLLVRGSNAAVIAFYEGLGFACEDVVCLGKRLLVDEPFVARPGTG